MNAAASNVVERKGGGVKMENAVFIGELLGAETKMGGKSFQSLVCIEYSILQSSVKNIS
jgi:hypothetical protein